MGSVPELPGCHTQAKTLDGLMERIKEAIELYLEVEPDILQKEESHFVYNAVQSVSNLCAFCYLFFR